MATSHSAQGESNAFAILTGIIARLRRECPWDREQTHASLRPNLLEECYEVLEALDSGAPARLREELGDLLLQVLLHAEIASQAGEFTIEQVIAGLTQKLIHRHPHVFGTAQVSNSQEVLDRWDQLKQRERGSLLASVPRAMPALSYAQEIQSRAARIGFDWAQAVEVLDKLREEAAELTRAASQQEQEQEMGDLLFTLVNLSRKLGIEAETALRQANQRFFQRLSLMEEMCRERGITIDKLNLAELDALWAEAKGKIEL